MNNNYWVVFRYTCRYVMQFLSIQKVSAFNFYAFRSYTITSIFGMSTALYQDKKPSTLIKTVKS